MKNYTNNQLLLKEYIKQEFEENASYKDEDSYFEFLAAQQMVKDYDLSDEEIETGIMGGGLDGGCDAIYIFSNGVLMNDDSFESLTIPKEMKLELVIIQAKNTTSFKEEAIMKWKTISENLLQFSNVIGDFTGRYNEDVLGAFENFRLLHMKAIRSRVRLHFNYIYVTLATELHPNVEAQASELKTIIQRLFPSKNVAVDVKFINADALMDRINSVSETRFVLPLSDTPINIGEKKDYITLVNIAKYYRFITDEYGDLRKSIFESNVRDYQGRNSVNNEIQESLTNSTGEDFWWLNNGITILASETSQETGKELVLVKPEIVNGLQTSTEIYNYFTEHPDMIEMEMRNVLVRVIVPNDDASRDRIILATNSQTNIPKSSLRATDPIHWQIEMYFKGRGLYYDRRKNYYKNLGKKSSEIISISFLAQCLMSLILQKPNYARARPSTLLENQENYEKLYLSHQNLNVFYNSAKLGKLVDKCIKGNSTFSATEKTDILFYTLYWAVVQKIGKTDISVDDLRDLDLGYFNEDKINTAANFIYCEYKQLGGNNQIAKSSTLIDSLKAKENLFLQEDFKENETIISK